MFYCTETWNNGFFVLAVSHNFTVKKSLEAKYFPPFKNSTDEYEETISVKKFFGPVV